MSIQYTLKFKEQYKKLPPKLQEQFDDRLRLFIANPTHPLLRIHPQTGNFIGYWSMNVSGDLRALYKQVGDEVTIFAFIGTHSQLYG